MSLPVPPQKPLKPAAPYMRFMKEQIKQRGMGVSPMDMMSKISNEWAQLDESIKKSYEDAFKAEDAAYTVAMVDYEQRKDDYENAVVTLGQAAQNSIPTDMSQIRQQIEIMIDELSNNPDIEVTKCRIDPGLNEAELNRAAELLGAELPDGMREFFSACGGLEVEWAVRASADMRDRGIINILPLLPKDDSIGLAICSDWEGSIWFTCHEGGERFKGVRPVDHFTPEACAALFPATPLSSQAPARMHYHYCGEELAPMNIDFPEYIALLLRSRGFWYWQQSLCLRTLPQPEAEHFLCRAPAIFPDLDPSLFLPRSRDTKDPTDSDDMASAARGLFGR